jgi:hypothetical protein
LSHPSAKYDFVSWDDEILNIWENKIHLPNHQPRINILRGNGRCKCKCILHSLIESQRERERNMHTIINGIDKWRNTDE